VGPRPGLGGDVRVVAPDHFDLSDSRGDAEAFLTILDAARRADGASGVNEATLLELQAHGLAQHTLLFDTSHPTGFALISSEGELDLVVTPDARGSGVGTRLLKPALALRPGRPVRAWSHGDHPAAAHLADRFGFVPARQLWRMEGGFETAAPQPPQPPSGVVIRRFAVGRDEAGFLSANAAAFAAHPEQGDLGLPGLTSRLAQPWFDPTDFYLAEREGEIVGFHWTKVLPSSPSDGEVYVIGVVPTAQGIGLGRVLLDVGLEHLRGRGVRRVSLYVEADNAPAIGLYEGHGFAHVSTDVQYVREET
jgi:mycothiol synthase